MLLQTEWMLAYEAKQAMWQETLQGSLLRLMKEEYQDTSDSRKGLVKK